MNQYFLNGEYKEDKIYPLYIQQITCCFELKKDKIPTIQIKGNRFIKENEYLESSKGKLYTLVLTNIDLKLFKENYKITEETYECGWKFKGIQGLFCDYIDKWIKVKIDATKTGNKALRTIAKLMLNSLYGKFATTLYTQSKNPYLGEDGIIHYSLGDKEDKKGIYLPIRRFYYCVCKRKNNSNFASYKRLFYK